MMAQDDEPSGGAPEWMCTFSDMRSLLLCFFVLLFSLSSIDKKKAVQASGSLSAAFGGLPAPYEVENIPDRKSEPEMSRPMQKERNVSYAKEELRREMEHRVRSANLQASIQVTGTEQGITFRLSGDALFDTASAELKPEAYVNLLFVAEQLIQFPSNSIKIEGHTDPTNSSADPNANWLLGAERAYNVMQYMIEVGCPYGQVESPRCSYESYADFAPLPGVDLNTAIGRALSRRVDIILLQTDDGSGTYFENPLEKNPRTPLSLDAINPSGEEP
jgi:chemotaxis protein MotB